MKKKGMKGLVSLDEMMASLPEDRRKAIEARGAEHVARIQKRMTLAEVRKSLKISQTAVAEVLGVGQMQISRLEKRKDPRFSTVQRMITAMGGKLTMVITFPNQPPMFLEATPISKKKKVT